MVMGRSMFKMVIFIEIRVSILDQANAHIMLPCASLAALRWLVKAPYLTRSPPYPTKSA